MRVLNWHHTGRSDCDLEMTCVTHMKKTHYISDLICVMDTHMGKQEHTSFDVITLSKGYDKTGHLKNVISTWKGNFRMLKKRQLTLVIPNRQYMRNNQKRLMLTWNTWVSEREVKWNPEIDLKKTIIMREREQWPFCHHASVLHVGHLIFHFYLWIQDDTNMLVSWRFCQVDCQVEKNYLTFMWRKLGLTCIFTCQVTHHLPWTFMVVLGKIWLPALNRHPCIEDIRNMFASP